MKKSITFLSLILAVGFLTTACSSNTSNNNASGDNNGTASSTSRRGGARMPDFGQPDRKPDVMGIVKSIAGNQVTILKIDRPNRGAGGPGSATSTDQKRPATLSLGGATGGGQGGGRPGGGGGFMGGGRPGSNSGAPVDRAAMLENLKKQSTGEVTVTIPVGIKMLIPDATDTTSNPPKMNEATLVDVKADKMLNIWLNQDVKDQSVAEFVFVR